MSGGEDRRGRCPGIVGLGAVGLAGVLACTDILGIEDVSPSTSPKPTLDASVDGGDGSCGDQGQPGSVALVRCGAECVDLDSRGDHCGTCFHDCMGGPCASGSCGELVVARDLTDLSDMAVSDDGLAYVASGAGRTAFLARAPPRSTETCEGADGRCIVEVPPPFLPSDTGTPYLRTVGWGQGTLYLGYPGFGVAKVPADGGAPSVVATEGAAEVSSLTIQNGVIFLGLSSQSLIARLEEGALPRPLAHVTSEASVTDVHVSPDGRQVFASILGLQVRTLAGFLRVDAQGAAPLCEDQTCLWRPGRSRSLTLGAGWVYMAEGVDENLTNILRTRPDGTCDGREPCPEPVITGTRVGGRGALVADEAHLYWVRCAGNLAPCEVRRIPQGQACVERDGAPCGEIFLSARPFPVRILQGGGAVYASFLQGDARIVRKAK